MLLVDLIILIAFRYSKPFTFLLETRFLKSLSIKRHLACCKANVKIKYKCKYDNAKLK